MVVCRVVIVGAGPSGLAAAYLLAENGCQVTLVERSADPSISDRSRGFSYSIGSHGIPVLERMGLGEELRSAGAPWSSAFAVYEIGKSPVRLPPQPFDTETETFWITRRAIMKKMLTLVREKALIDIRLSTSVGSVSYSSKVASVQLTDADGKVVGVVEADLVVGCDGVHSMVRRQLEGGKYGSVKSRSGFALINKKKAPTSGAQVKSFRLGPSPKLPPLPGDDKYHVTSPTELVTFNTKDTRYGGLGLVAFPGSSDPEESRYATMVAPPDAPVWKAKTAEEMYDLLQSNFPYLDIRALVDAEDMTKFVDASPVVLPNVQRSASLGGWWSENAGVALVGDAAKCFPPDYGQGLNSSLEDAATLVDALAKSSSVRDAVQLYEQKRDPEIDALCKMLMVGYNVFAPQKTIRGVLLEANSIVRIILNQIAPLLFHPPFLLAMDQGSYSNALKNAEKTTFRIGVITAAFAGIAAAFIQTRL